MKIRDMVSKLYNAGEFPLEEVICYSLPAGHDNACVARHRVYAPAKDFFEVPNVIEVDNGGGETVSIYTQFTKLLLREDRWGARGVVLIDAQFKDKDPEDLQPVAATEKEAVAKAGRILERYEKGVVQAFIDQCNTIRAAGGVPVAARGYIKRCLEKYGVADPSQAILTKTGETNSQIETLQEQVKKLNDQLAALVASGKNRETART